MLKFFIKPALQLIMISIFLTIIGCGVKSVSRKKKMEIPQLVSMEIPKGWVLDSSHMCHKGEYNTGMLLEEVLGTKNFEKTAIKMSKEFGSEILTTDNFKINNYNAIKTHIKAPNGVNTLRVYIHKGNQIIWISFAIESKEMYSKYESALQKSIKSIKIK